MSIAKELVLEAVLESFLDGVDFDYFRRTEGYQPTRMDMKCEVQGISSSLGVLTVAIVKSDDEFKVTIEKLSHDVMCFGSADYLYYKIEEAYNKMINNLTRGDKLLKGRVSGDGDFKRLILSLREPDHDYYTTVTDGRHIYYAEYKR